MHLALLITTLLALLSGPLLYAAARERAPLRSLIDVFVLVSVVGLVLLEVLPEAYAAGGLWSFAFLGLGLLGPTLIEHGLTRARRGAHIAALVLALAGLMAHSFGDGAALSPAGSGHTALALAVAIHSVPVGLLVWWLMYPVYGAMLPTLTLAAMCASTVAGYVLGVELSHSLDAHSWAFFQALVAGSILHVAFGRPHLHGHDNH